MLLRKVKSAEERENLTSCHNYLMKAMGERFKFMAISHPARSKTEVGFHWSNDILNDILIGDWPMKTLKKTEMTGFYKIEEDLSAFMRAPRNHEPGEILVYHS